ncbi:medium-chain acyl-[acyl-carrier-protein] hydrolase [Parafrankia irregularis]|uniref:Medium-chain acyl-[acyl-carrier-protein] hydrolase n=1 Tax=Parafrankia irregularis TaxID=795642 RepID=A0A0S4QR40_9ACTN|nr:MULTISPECIES: alpha/beta fold hydrolase [Parafrankia]MBE3199924.1 thioesterase [Parafrankia sp. CH37]CUU58081.1 medium-chain acyl-[acyl-carrier-protein] hydrolase [Parafrankia irregularis]
MAGPRRSSADGSGVAAAVPDRPGVGGADVGGGAGATPGSGVPADRALPRNPWIHRGRVTGARIRLYCFPFAGGSAASYLGWQAELGAQVQVCAVEPPGRRQRRREPAIRRMDAMVDAVVAGLRPGLDEPFAFFGHSLGALVAYEVARRLRAEGGPEPALLFLSAAAAPHLPRRRREIAALPDTEFIDELRGHGGTPELLLADHETMRLFLPALRADFELFETYRHRPGDPPGCPVHIYGGRTDTSVNTTQLRAWRALLPTTVEVRTFPGDHFYLNADRPALLAAVAECLAGRWE